MERVGKINVFADLSAPEVQKSIHQFMEFIGDDETIVSAALMPDCHLGYAVPIGGVFASEGYVYPSAVGYDIGCGMCAMPLRGVKADEIRSHKDEIFEMIMKNIPVGFNIHKKLPKDNAAAWENLSLEAHPELGERHWNVSKALWEIAKLKNAPLALGTLGGGNHFIEVGADRDDEVWVVIHSGSRGFGHGIATRYMKLAANQDKPNPLDFAAKEGHYGFHVDTTNGKDYIADLNFALDYALINRRLMVASVVDVIETVLDGKESGRCVNWDYLINRNHNHAELHKESGLWIHRKGATHAEEGMLGVIPGNMRDGSFIVEGLGNPTALDSSSHGAGRVMGRKEAKRSLDYDEFVEEMGRHGIACRTDEKVLDESPKAYKNIHEVMAAQSDMVRVLAHVRPIVNVKG